MQKQKTKQNKQNKKQNKTKQNKKQSNKQTKLNGVFTTGKKFKVDFLEN